MQTVENTGGYESNDAEKQLDGCVIALSRESLEAGENVLRQMEPEYFEHGQDSGWYFDLVTSIVVEVIRVCRKVRDTPLENP